MNRHFADQRGAVAHSLLLSVSLLVLAAALVFWWTTRPGPLAEAAEGSSHYVVEFHDYYYTPSHMTWHVGETVTLTFVNRSEAHPGKGHEFMLGRNPRDHQTILGTDQEDGFETEFFRGITVQFGSAKDVEMVMPGKANVVGKEASQYFMRMPMDQKNGGMDMGNGDDSGGMDMGNGDDSGGMDMGNGDDSGSMDMGNGDEGASKGMVMKGNGLMVTLKPIGRASIRFTVPDRPGEWTYGCFEQSGQHFLNGMHGTVTVVE